MNAAAATSLAVDIEAYDGVRSAAAYLTGPGQSPFLYIPCEPSTTPS